MGKNKLTESEECLMNIFWSQGTPLTSVDILKLTTDKKWSSNYIHKILGMLQEKGYIQVCGVSKTGTHYARQFKVCLAKEEYISNLIDDQGVGVISLAKIAMALVKKKVSNNKKDANHEQLMSELKKVIEQLEAQSEQEEN